MKQRKQQRQRATTDSMEATGLPVVYEALMRVGNTVRPHLPVLGAVGGGLLLVAVIALSVVTARGAKIARGYAELGEATTADEMLEIAERYVKLPPGEAAAFRAAQQLLIEGRCDQACTRFSLFCREYPQSRDFVRARLGEAYGLEGDEKLIQAGKAFVEFVELARELADDPELIAEAYVGAGRCAHSQGMLAEARKWYEAAVSSGSEGRYKDAALDELKELAVAPAEDARAATEVAAEDATASGDTEEDAKPEAESDAAEGAAQKLEGAEGKDVGAKGEKTEAAPGGDDKAAAKPPPAPAAEK